MPYNDAQRIAFDGTVENTTGATLRQVRVEVRLSDGAELGPTTPVDLEPGETSAVTLSGTATEFEGWTAHPEVGRGEHGPEDELRSGRTPINGETGRE